MLDLEESRTELADEQAFQFQLSFFSSMKSAKKGEKMKRERKGPTERRRLGGNQQLNAGETHRLDSFYRYRSDLQSQTKLYIGPNPNIVWTLIL